VKTITILLCAVTVFEIIISMRSDAAKQAAFERAADACEHAAHLDAMRVYRLKPQQHSETVTVTAKVTGYCPCRKCCGKWAAGGANRLTAGGRSVTSQNGAAVPKSIPFGAKIRMPDGTTLIADDTGGAMRQSWERGVLHIDRRFSTHREALKWGVRTLAVTIEGCSDGTCRESSKDLQND